jgi:hypothetical protein
MKVIPVQLFINGIQSKKLIYYSPVILVKARHLKEVNE